MARALLFSVLGLDTVEADFTYFQPAGFFSLDFCK